MVVFSDQELCNSAKAPVNGVVRGECVIGGWYLEPVDNGRRTKATYLLEVDLKGIPQWALKQANKEQGYQVQTLRTIVKKYLEDNPEYK